MSGWYHGNLYASLGLRPTCRCGRTDYLSRDEATREAKGLRKRYGRPFVAVKCKGGRTDYGHFWTGRWHIGLKP